MNSVQYKYCSKKRRSFSTRIGSCICAPMLYGCLLLLFTACSSFSIGQNTPSTVLQQPIARLTYVALGASDTFGIGADDPPTQSWPADLSTLLGRQVHLINLGVPDIHVHNALTVELPVAFDAHPNLVTIWLAVNDLADKVPVVSYAHDLDLLLTRLQTASPHLRIAVANVPDLTLLPRFKSDNAQVLKAQTLAYNSAISAIVARHSVLLVDLFHSNLAQHPEYISGDGFHPSTLGYTQVAQLFYQILKT